MTAPLHIRGDALTRADNVWRAWREMRTAPPGHHIVRWTVERSNGGSVHIGFTSEMGWAQWVRFLGLHIDNTVMANSLWAGALIDGVRIYATCPREVEGGVAA